MLLGQERILVTGGAGFLGAHLCCRLLDQGHEVLCVDNFSTGTRRNIEDLFETLLREHGKSAAGGKKLQRSATRSTE